MKSSRSIDKYKKMQVQFGLPRISELKETFKFDIDDYEKIVDQIRMEISDRIFIYTEKIIEPLIAEPDSLSSLLEQNMISEADRARLFKIYAKIQMIKWENNSLTITGNDKEAAEWIRRTWDFWNSELKQELADICRKLSLSWKELKTEKEERTSRR